MAKRLTYLNDALLGSLRLVSEKGIFGRFVEAGKSALGADYGYSYAYTNTPDQQFKLLYTSKHIPYIPSTPRKTGIVAKTFKKKKPTLISDVTKVGYIRSDAKEHMRAVAVIPVAHRSKTYGVILLCFNKAHTFSEEEKTLCAFIGHNAAQALTVHGLHRDLQNFKHTLDKTQDLIFMFDPNSLTVSYANREAEQQLGLTRAFNNVPVTARQSTFTKTSFQDFLTHIRKHPQKAKLTDITFKSKEGKPISAEGLFQYLHLPGQNAQFLAVVRNIEERRRAERQIKRVAYFDSLTKLPNRAYFLEQLERIISNVSSANGIFALLFLDLDRFKLINDILGHNAGDQLIKQVGARLRTSVKGRDFVARLGGDEFVIILNEISSEADATFVAKRILSLFKKPFTLEGQEVYIGTSIGIAVFPLDGKDTLSLLKAADRALYRGKEEGGGSYQHFRADKVLPTRQLELEKQLRSALNKDQFALHYQPQIHIPSGDIVSCEALLRWHHPEHGVLGPDQFMSLAEESGVIVEIGRWVVEQALMQHRRWKAIGLPPIRIGVNLSARQLLQSDLVDFVRMELARATVDPQYIELELTESMVMKNVDLAMELLNQFTKMGIRCLMDDFGTGYTSIHHLKRLPVNVIKIDKSFIKGVSTEPNDRAIVSAIISMAHQMHKQVVAEGVETIDQLQFLQQHRCDVLQGFLLSPALPAHEFVAWYAKPLKTELARILPTVR